MSDHQLARWLEWGVRLLVLALLALWIIAPPHAGIKTSVSLSHIEGGW